jgi:hypothetical protein
LPILQLIVCYYPFIVTHLLYLKDFEMDRKSARLKGPEARTRLQVRLSSKETGQLAAIGVHQKYFKAEVFGLGEPPKWQAKL